MSLLSVRNLTVQYGPGAVAVDDTSFDIARGETVALVGESGCGKSTIGLALLRILDHPGRIAGGQILFDGVDCLTLCEPAMRALRGRRMAMIFQDPMSCLNPVYTVGSQLIEAVLLHEVISEEEAWSRAVAALRRVGLPDPKARMGQYPHEMSGGMKQRVMIAMALICTPELLIADEPTTALDVTVQAQILDLLRRLQTEDRLSMLLVTHDLGLVADTAERVLVMYSAHVVESAATAPLFAEPLHPYTKALFGCLPRADCPRGRLVSIPGRVPDLNNMPTGCRFHPRCPLANERCRREEPVLEEKRPGRLCACHRVEVSQ